MFILALAWAVERRIRVSRVRAVMGEVWGDRERFLCDPHRGVPFSKERGEPVPQFPPSWPKRELTLATSESMLLWLRRREYSSAM